MKLLNCKKGLFEIAMLYQRKPLLSVGWLVFIKQKLWWNNSDTAKEKNVTNDESSVVKEKTIFGISTKTLGNYCGKSRDYFWKGYDFTKSVNITLWQKSWLVMSYSARQLKISYLHIMKKMEKNSEFLERFKKIKTVVYDVYIMQFFGFLPQLIVILVHLCSPTQNKLTQDEKRIKNALKAAENEMINKEDKNKVDNQQNYLPKFDKKVIFILTMALFLSGADLTGATLIVILQYLANNPDVQNKLREVVGKLIPPNADDQSLEDPSKLSSAIADTLRKCPMESLIFLSEVIKKIVGMVR